MIELKENTFSDITFDMIQIINCHNLKTIHKNTFNTTDSLTTHISIEFNPKLTSPDNSIFEALSKFVRLEQIELGGNNITEIPSNAFQNKQDQLKFIQFFGKSFKKLGNNTFSQLKSLAQLFITQTSIDFIPENAFEFNEKSENQMTINLGGNKYLNNSGLSENSLTKLKRPTTLDVYSSTYSNFTFLEQKIFQPFFKSNDKNQIKLNDYSLDCSDCRNYWLKQNPTLLKQLTNSNCSNGKLLTDADSFENCSG